MKESHTPEYYEIINETKLGKKLIREELEDEDEDIGRYWKKRVKHKEKKKDKRGVIKNRRVSG